MSMANPLNVTETDGLFCLVVSRFRDLSYRSSLHDQTYRDPFLPKDRLGAAF